MKRISFKSPVLRLGRTVTILTLLAGLLSCCTNFSDFSKESEQQRLKVMSWNLQTFFDANFDGNEYDEYKSSKRGWTQEKYEARLDRLASVIKKLDADIIIMEEIEKEAQLQDIKNRLSGTFDFSKVYTHTAFTSEEKSSIGCALLSRYPISDISAHSMEIYLEQKQPAIRPILQCTVQKKGKNLVLFVNHWKSKSGGAEESEIWRKRQEKLLSDLIWKAQKENSAVLAAGDFNKDISEFASLEGKDGKTKIMLRGKRNVEVYSPWILEDGTYKSPGSYWYKANWERIDHFFAAGNVELEEFNAENDGEWADSEGHPRRYQVWNGKGYSDHLPITCTVMF